MVTHCPWSIVVGFHFHPFWNEIFLCCPRSKGNPFNRITFVIFGKTDQTNSRCICMLVGLSSWFARVSSWRPPASWRSVVVAPVFLTSGCCRSRLLVRESAVLTPTASTWHLHEAARWIVEFWATFAVFAFSFQVKLANVLFLVWR